MMRVLLATASLLYITQAYNIAIFVPNVANSQLLFNKRVGEELAHAGHNVTLFLLELVETEHSAPKISIDPRIHVITVNSSSGINLTEIDHLKSFVAFRNIAPWDERNTKTMSIFTDAYKGCKVLIANSSFIEMVRDSKFDVAFTHMYNYCPIGIIHLTKIPSWIWLSSGVLLDSMAASLGVPVPPSYCPPMLMDAGDHLTFWQRVKSFVGLYLFKVGFNKIISDRETVEFRKRFGNDFPDLAELASKAPLAMINSNELYDFARPTLHKIINIGGVGIKQKDAKELTGEYAKRTAKAKDGVIVFSFGSVAPTYLLPDDWKEAFYAAFSEFPNIQFFIKHERPEMVADTLPDNVYAAKWLPQADLLQHEKTIALITHGGYNSVQDAIHSGKPALTTALFGDQFRNAQLLEKLGVGINMPKEQVSKETVVRNIRRLIEDKSLRENAARLREMVATKPIPVETLLVKWTEFLAQHKSLDNLVPAGAELNIFIYHSIDVLLFLFLAVSLLIFIIYKAIFCACRLAYRFVFGQRTNSKKEARAKKNQ